MCSTKTETLVVAREFHFLLESQMGLKIFEHYFCTNFLNFHILFRIFGVTEVYSISRLLQTVLFLTDSVFYVLFIYFGESMGSAWGMNHGEVGIQ